MSLRCSAVSYAYARHGQTALSGVSVELAPGTICAVVGRNGSGKSTLLRLLCGIERPTSGHVTWSGHEMASMREPERAAVCAYVPQRPALSAAFTVRELVSLGQRASGGGLHSVDSALEAMGISDLASRLWHRTSEGQRVRSAVARALVQCTERGLLVMDEPFAALDPGECARLMGVIRKVRSRGMAVVCAIHHTGIASLLADQVWWLDEGRLIGAGSAASVLEPTALQRTFGVPFGEHEGQILPILPAASS
jgi:ABC-type cobalamin/Fe3+-siderophores transport system ATPase subunit